MSEQNEQALTIVTAVESKGSMRGGREDQVRKLVDKSVPLDQLQQNFKRFLGNLEQIFLDVGQGKVGDFLLDEVTFSVEIGAEGEIKLLGTGVGVSGSSGVSFTLRRQSNDKGE
jgi:hypothetical protein